MIVNDIHSNQWEALSYDTIVDRLLKECIEGKYNSAYIRISQFDFPYLHVLILGDMAVIHYFSKDKDAGWITIEEGRPEEGLHEFFLDDIGTPAYLGNKHIVNLDLLKDVIDDFISNNSLPESASWMKL